MNSLILILLQLVQITHFGKDLGVCGYLGDQNGVPLEGLSLHTNQFVDMSNLEDDLIRVRNYGVQLLEGL